MRLRLRFAIVFAIVLGPFDIFGSDLAPVEKTGQTKCFSSSVEIPCGGTGQDGELQEGLALPSPRFTDTGDGGVLDNLTGLKWLKDAKCVSLPATDSSGRTDWLGALSAANNLGNGVCGLTDGSSPGNWRLPNVKEMMSLVHFAYSRPALSDAEGTGQWTAGNPFTNVDSLFAYWTSTTNLSSPSQAIDVAVGVDGTQRTSQKTNLNYVWPVTGPDNDDRPVFPVPVEKTGQSTCYSFSAEIPCAGTGQDGDLQRGVPFPNPRFSILKNGFVPNGVVRDNMTGLEWLRIVDCDELPGVTNGYSDWWGAHAGANNLADGVCGLADGSSIGDWRLPNVRELQSIIHHGFFSPAVSNSAGTGELTRNDPFGSFGEQRFWTSTTNQFVVSEALAVLAGLDGTVISQYKPNILRVWPVKGQSVQAWVFADGFESGNLIAWSETSFPTPDCEQIAVTNLGGYGSYDWRATISNGLASKIFIKRTVFTWVPPTSTHRVNFFALDYNDYGHDYYGGNDYGPVTDITTHLESPTYSVNADINPNDGYTSWYAHMYGPPRQPGFHEVCFDFIVVDLPFPEAYWSCPSRCAQYTQP